MELLIIQSILKLKLLRHGLLLLLGAVKETIWYLIQVAPLRHNSMDLKKVTLEVFCFKPTRLDIFLIFYYYLGVEALTGHCACGTHAVRLNILSDTVVLAV